VKKKKVLLVANVGKEHVIKFHIPTITMLKSLGYEVDVACGGDEEIPECDHQYKLSYSRATFNPNTLKGFLETKRIAEKGNYDMIYCHTAVGGTAGRIAGLKLRRNGTKVVYCGHGYEFYKGCRLINWLTFYPNEWLWGKFTDAILCINQEDYDITKKSLRPKRTYLINGIGFNEKRFDVEDKNSVRNKYRMEFSIPDNATVLIYLAELTDNKNQKLLLDMQKEILKTRNDVYLVLAGFDHLGGAYEKYASELGISSNVRFLGWREDVGSLYAMSDICVASSIMEGLGLNIVEAMYCGLPVVASQNRGHATIIRDGENGFLIPLGDSKRFADRVLQLITDKDLKERFVKEGYDTQEKYQSENVLQQLKNILTEEMER